MNATHASSTHAASANAAHALVLSTLGGVGATEPSKAAGSAARAAALYGNAAAGLHTSAEPTPHGVHPATVNALEPPAHAQQRPAPAAETLPGGHAVHACASVAPAFALYLPAAHAPAQESAPTASE
jgi:hypothetical protein